MTPVVGVITALGSLGAFGGFVIALLDYRKRHYPANATPAQPAGTPPRLDTPSPSARREPKGRLLVVLAILGTALAVVSVLLFVNSWPNSRSNTGSPPTHVASANTTAPTGTAPPETSAAPSATPTTTTPAPIRITYPPKVSSKYAVPQVISVKGTGDVSPGRHLWIFVYAPSTATYYPQDNPVEALDPAPWTVVGVKVGSSAAEERGHGFAIYAVLVDDPTHARIFANSGGFSRNDWQRLFLPHEVDEVLVQRR